MSDKAQAETIQFSWHWNWKILVFALLFLPLTLRLGFWQLSRAEEKQLLLQAHEQRMSAQPVSMDRLKASEEHQYRPVRVSGHYDNRRTLLLDNRVRRGRPGYEVISVFRAADGRTLLVNRGWVEASLDRSILPDIASVDGETGISGYLYRSPGKQVMLGEDNWQADKAVQIVQNAAPELAAEKLGEAFFPYQLRLDAGAPGAYETGWPVVNIMPGKHTGYAVQWFSLAALLLVLTLLANSNLAAMLRSRGPGESND